MTTLKPKVFSMLALLEKYGCHITAVVFYVVCYVGMLDYVVEDNYVMLALSAFIVWVMGILPVTFVVAVVISLLSDSRDLARQLFEPKH